MLFEGDADALRDLARHVAALDGPVRPILRVGDQPLDLLLAERSTSTNTAAAGGNASLMTIG